MDITFEHIEKASLVGMAAGVIGSVAAFLGYISFLWSTLILFSILVGLIVLKDEFVGEQNWGLLGLIIMLVLSFVILIALVVPTFFFNVAAWPLVGKLLYMIGVGAAIVFFFWIQE